MTVSRRNLIGTMCAVSVFGVPLTSSAQTGTRSNPIKIVVPYPPGGPLDVWHAPLPKPFTTSLATLLLTTVRAPEVTVV